MHKESFQVLSAPHLFCFSKELKHAYDPALLFAQVMLTEVSLGLPLDEDCQLTLSLHLTQLAEARLNMRSTL